MTTTMTVTIRPASEGDCGAIAEVHVASWRAAYAGILDAGFLAALSAAERERMWRAALAAGNPELLVASAGGAVLGFAAFGGSRDEDAPSQRAELWALYVDPGAWGQGVGRRLWLAASARLAERGCASTSLWVLSQNARAIRFYSAAGFKPEPGTARTFELGGRRIEEVRMLLESG